MTTPAPASAQRPRAWYGPPTPSTPAPAPTALPSHPLVRDEGAERWIVARGAPDGPLWLDVRHTAGTPEAALALARLEDTRQPQWARSNAVAAVVLVRLTILEERPVPEIRR